MQITWVNYKAILPESLHEKFLALAQSKRATITPIIYVDRTLRFANADEL
jgi:hypothetical protein